MVMFYAYHVGRSELLSDMGGIILRNASNTDANAAGSHLQYCTVREAKLWLQIMCCDYKVWHDTQDALSDVGPLQYMAICLTPN